MGPAGVASSAGQTRARLAWPARVWPPAARGFEAGRPSAPAAPAVAPTTGASALGRDEYAMSRGLSGAGDFKCRLRTGRLFRHWRPRPLWRRRRRRRRCLRTSAAKSAGAAQSETAMRISVPLIHYQGSGKIGSNVWAGRAARIIFNDSNEREELPFDAPAGRPSQRAGQQVASECERPIIRLAGGRIHFT